VIFLYKINIENVFFLYSYIFDLTWRFWNKYVN